MKNTEYQTLVSREEFIALYSLYKPWEEISQTLFYYDTEDLQLKKRGICLYVKQIQDSYFFVFRLTNAGKTREISLPIEENRIDRHEKVLDLLVRLNVEASSLKVMAIMGTVRRVYLDEYGALQYDFNSYNDTQDYEIRYVMKKETRDFFTRFRNKLKMANITYHPADDKIDRCVATLKTGN